MLTRQLTRFAPVLFNGGQSLTAQVQALFAAGRVGGMWDLGDTSTLFQDSSTPVAAVTQPIGIVLDKSRGLALGSEAVPSTNWNGGYTTNGAKQIPTGWTEYTPANVASATVLPNSYQFTATAHLAGIALAGFAGTIVGKFNKYTIRARKTAFVSGTPTLQLYTGAWQEIVPSGAAIGDWYTKTIYVLATQNIIISSFNGSASWEVEYLTVRELPGNHATQSTAIKRPLYQVVGGYGCAQFDATDDALLFPAITFGGAFNTFVAGKTTGGTRGIPLWRTADAGNGYWGVYENASGAPSNPATGVGTPSYAVNGVVLSPATRGELYSRINGLDSVTETTGIVLSAETALQFSGYAGGYLFQGNAHRVLMISGTLTAGEKLLCRQWAAEGNGVTVV